MKRPTRKNLLKLLMDLFGSKAMLKSSATYIRGYEDALKDVSDHYLLYGKDAGVK